MPETKVKTRDTLKAFTLSIQRNESSQPIIYKNAVNAFTKGALYCVMVRHEDGTYSSVKYPLVSIFRVTEDY